MSIKADFLTKIFEKAQTDPKKILLAEADIDQTTLQAAIKIADLKIAKPVLLAQPGNTSNLLRKIKGINGTIPEEISIIDPQTHKRTHQQLAEQLTQIRKHKALSYDKAFQLLQSPYYYSVMLLHNDEVDGIITGRNCSTKISVKPAFQILKPKQTYNLASSFFIMLHENKLLIFADCAINIDPTPRELMQIALDTAKTSQHFGIKPKIAFLSFSTNQSSLHPDAQKIVEATSLTKDYIKTNNLPYIVDGDIQVDAALIPEISEKKFPNNSLQGQANILIFPNLFSGNIAYKMVERLGNAEALGPILQGLSKPFNDLSRGSKEEDIINLTALTTLEAQSA
jgi:phosphate acetyltransferase